MLHNKNDSLEHMIIEYLKINDPRDEQKHSDHQLVHKEHYPVFFDNF